MIGLGYHNTHRCRVRKNAKKIKPGRESTAKISSMEPEILGFYPRRPEILGFYCICRQLFFKVSAAWKFQPEPGREFWLPFFDFLELCELMEGNVKIFLTLFATKRFCMSLVLASQSSTSLLSVKY